MNFYINGEKAIVNSVKNSRDGWAAVNVNGNSSQHLIPVHLSDFKTFAKFVTGGNTYEITNKEI